MKRNWQHGEKSSWFITFQSSTAIAICPCPCALKFRCKVARVYQNINLQEEQNNSTVTNLFYFLLLYFSLKVQQKTRITILCNMCRNDFMSKKVFYLCSINNTITLIKYGLREKANFSEKQCDNSNFLQQILKRPTQSVPTHLKSLFLRSACRPSRIL